MDKEQAKTTADVLMDIERAKNPAKSPRQVAPPQQRTTGLGAVIGFGFGMIVGGFFLESTFPASLIGLILGALAGRYFGHRIAPTKA